MWASTATILSLLTIVTNTVSAAFNPKTDACVPRATAYQEAGAQNLLTCTKYFLDQDFAVFDCGSIRRFSWNIALNQIRMIVSTPPTDAEFTVHAECLVNGKVVDAYDLRVPMTQGVGSRSVYRGFRKPCDPNKRGNGIRVYSYMLSNKTLGQCSLNPISPIA